MLFQSGIFSSFDAPQAERSWIDLFSKKEMQNLFSDSFRFKNPILDFLKEAPLKKLPILFSGYLQLKCNFVHGKNK